MIADEQLRKLAENEVGTSRGLPIKRFVEDHNESRQAAYDRLMLHHGEETKVLYDTIAELAGRLLEGMKGET